MSSDSFLTATPRDSTGSAAARDLRRQGKIPATLYGGGKKTPPQNLTINEVDLLALLRAGKLAGKLVTLKVKGRKIDTLPKEIQLDPVRDNFLHCDFMRIDSDSAIQLSVPVSFVDHEASPGLKRGGTLNIVRHEIEISCLPHSIPEALEASLQGLDFNDSLHVSVVSLPDGVSLTITDRDFTLATLVAPASEDEDDDTVDEDSPDADSGETTA